MSTGTPFSRDWLLSEALRVARQPYVEAEQDTHLGALGNIGHDEYRSIRFQKGASIWQREGRGFTVDLLHPGFIYKNPIELDLVVGGRARGVRFTPNIFDYGPGVKRPDDGVALNYSGFGSRYPINRADVLDEFLVFQGASYFRAVGRGQRYGLSARGLAVKTGDKEGEEFPAFTRFWIERPPVGATKLV
ncbi:MAG: glucan biosynthesis protein, partial [Gammaproteobacteria bacterium]